MMSLLAIADELVCVVGNCRQADRRQTSRLTATRLTCCISIVGSTLWYVAATAWPWSLLQMGA